MDKLARVLLLQAALLCKLTWVRRSEVSFDVDVP